MNWKFAVEYGDNLKVSKRRSERKAVAPLRRSLIMSWPAARVTGDGDVDDAGGDAALSGCSMRSLPHLSQLSGTKLAEWRKLPRLSQQFFSYPFRRKIQRKSTRIHRYNCHRAKWRVVCKPPWRRENSYSFFPRITKKSEKWAIYSKQCVIYVGIYIVGNLTTRNDLLFPE